MESFYQILNLIIRHLKTGWISGMWNSNFLLDSGFKKITTPPLALALKETSIPWAVRLSWLENAYSGPSVLAGNFDL